MVGVPVFWNRTEKNPLVVFEMESASLAVHSNRGCPGQRNVIYVAIGIGR